MPNSDSKPIVLVVDDDSRNLILISLCLREEYEVITASNAQEAMDQINKLLPDIILLDIMMPEISGYALCTKLKTYTRTKEIPIIFISAKDSTEDVIKGLDLGADDYITKPFSSAEVLARIRSTLRVYARMKNSSTPISDLPFISEEINIDDLTEKEREILDLIAHGCSNKDISDKLFISEFTVKNHLKNMFKKLKVSSRTQLVLVGLKTGIVK